MQPLLQKFLNTTPIEYVSQTRIGEACKLFENTDMKITAIAEMTGFADYSYFHRVFKKYAGCTPKEYQLKVKVYKENEILRK